jgi:hypothetical protein
MGNSYIPRGRNTKNYGGSYEVPESDGQACIEPRKFIVKEKIKDMMKYGMPLLDKFPRRNRKMADMMRDSMLAMYRYSTEIEKKIYKKTTLQNLDVELSLLKGLVVMASDRDYYGHNYAPPLSIHEREVWARYNDEIGRLIGGYKNFLDSKDQNRQED